MTSTAHGVEGGEFWRITPQLSWYLTDYSRVELVYGYGVLDKFGLTRHDAVPADALPDQFLTFRRMTRLESSETC